MTLIVFCLFYVSGMVLIGIPMAWKSVQLCCEKKKERWGAWGYVLLPLTSYVRNNPSFNPYFTWLEDKLQKDGRLNTDRFLLYIVWTMLIWPLRVVYSITWFLVWFLVIMYRLSCEVKYSTPHNDRVDH
ncbi:hypothetical protein A3B85_01560 [Candidatus Nomurabacteria bacterium RIFCSPHIGHO2_02_FULL_37_13]|uniref:Uncharacterized protein n=1 Tax=Candidatus Nomurabacteria bacterium RIFCSPHIGHO2_02_FULL_37_13 TaxID=1801750 RepID=A0A1F6W5A6_9BACT|nr:MAG: hypothetical protein A2640_01920 [Candidatus Nomurabacteria bacterium RIFCSPHIGHO2_01_FULL_36_23]OGI77117.1 MAG: hypothetical protein A3B85_01560 [Candidatus Nomurabacteria bacterium RIFCSPHIGHO2_02_FULL_37_13]OGI88196.1 MAG: hypothetical protein A2906_01395 [Candidatus Nomurabacteria bacterium RIFCSPLOWO2_01_FULL_37_25]